MEAKNSILNRHNFFTLIILIIITSCFRNQEVNYYDLYYSNEKTVSNIPIKRTNYLLFIKNNETITILETYEIFMFHKNHNIKSKYNIYFNDVLNGRANLETSSKNTYKLNKDIVNDFNNIGINDFLNKYSSANSANRYLVKVDNDDNKTITVLYLLLVLHILPYFCYSSLHILVLPCLPKFYPPYHNH